MIFKFDDSQALQQFNQQSQYNRKDSGASEIVAFLNPSGRTSRISSVGSQGSAVSRLSGASGISRSPSPHKMLVETSFCGPKPIEPLPADANNVDDVESVILARRSGGKVGLSAESPAQTPKTTSEKLKEASMTPAEAARAAARELRRKEIEALKVRLNEINQKQLAKAKEGGGEPLANESKAVQSSSGRSRETSKQRKKIVGITPEGTEYFRIKLKADDQYEDRGISPNERIIEDSEFSSKSKKEAKSSDQLTANPSQVSKISPTTHDNRSPSPASASVSRKSSFCSFFRSKETPTNEIPPTKSRSSSRGAVGGRVNDKSPLPSPSKSSLSSRIGSLLFKSNRTMSPSQTEACDGKAATKQITTKQPLPQSNDKRKLRYYEADVVRIPLHTPPEEKEFTEFKKKTADVDKIESAPLDSAPPITSQPASISRIAPTAVMEKMQSTDEVELHDVPNSRRKISEDQDAGSSLWSVEVQRHSSQESQETVISQQNGNHHQHVVVSARNGLTEKPAIPAYINTNEQQQQSASESQQIENEPQQQQPPLPMSAKGRHKKRILFSTKIGSGSEEQIFSTQLSLSKTESQSSQLSEQASIAESPKNEESGTKMPEVTSSASSLKHQSSSEVEKVTVSAQVRSHRSSEKTSDSDDAKSQQFQQPNRKSSQQRDSGEFSAPKRESSDDTIGRRCKHSDSPGMSSRTSQSSLKQNQPPPKRASRMDISSESDRESEADAGCVHKRASRDMEDHESAGLVLQESFDDELPYVPTTLPEEKAFGLRIIPTRERSQTELITIPVERPRSTTPINPASLDNYCGRKQSDSSEGSLVRGEKLRISLPRQKAEQVKENVQQKQITRRTSNLSNKSWTEFAEQQIPVATRPKSAERSSSRKKQSSSTASDYHQHQFEQYETTTTTSDVIAHKPTAQHPQKVWIDFDNIPEKRQPPKKITTIPTNKDPLERAHHKHSRQYVSPEECQCECHEHGHGSGSHKKDDKHSSADSSKTPTSEDSQAEDDNDERQSLMR